MNRIRPLFSFSAGVLATLGLLALAGCQREASEPAVPGGPVETVAQWYRDARRNAIDELVRLMLPPQAYEALRRDWQRWASSPEAVSDHDREQFARMMADLTADGAEARLYAQLEPSLVRFENEVAAQLPLMIAMGTGFASAGIQENSELSEAQKRHATELIGVLAGWLAAAPLADRERARAAITAIVAAAREVELRTIEDVQALEFEQMLDKAGVAAAAIKAVLAGYGLDLDASLEGARFELVESAGDRARVRVRYPLAAAELEYEQELVHRDGRWYGAELLDLLAARAERREADAQTQAGPEAEASQAAPAASE